MSKRCSLCKITKDLCEFTPQIRGKFGVTGRCKGCRALLHKDVYKDKKQYYLQKGKEYRITHPEYSQAWDKNHVAATILRRIKSRAKSIGVPFDLEEHDIVIPEFCPALGIKLEFHDYRQHNSPSIDRIIPNKGYVKDNIVIVSSLANRIKTDATVEQLSQVAEFYRNLDANICP
jgi:hypothetical protein